MSLCLFANIFVTHTGEGLITYMRTDGVSLSAEAVDSLRDTISSVYGVDHLPAGGPRVYKSRAKNAQVSLLANDHRAWYVVCLGGVVTFECFGCVTTGTSHVATLRVQCMRLATSVTVQMPDELCS